MTTPVTARPAGPWQSPTSRLPAVFVFGALAKGEDYLDRCNVTQYTSHVIKTFRHKGLQAFFERGTKAGIQAAHAPKLARLLARLSDASCPEDMNLPGWRLHPLKGADLGGHFSVWVNGNWRMTFAFKGVDAVLVDYQDYH